MFLKKLKGPLMLLITAFFWGTTFVAQSLGSDHIGAFTYNAGRFIITGIILLSPQLSRGIKISLSNFLLIFIW